MNNSIEIIDLTYNIEAGMPTFSAHWHPVVKINQLGRVGFEGRNTREICIGSHTGTHVDAPLHFVAGGKSIDEISLHKLIGEVSIVDFTYLKENEYITVEMLQKNIITPRMIFKFGWGKYWGDKKYYKDYPFFSVEATQYLIDKGIELIGMDTASPDDSRIILGSNEDSQIHKLLLKNSVVIVEYLANLDKITNYDGWNLIALPLKLKGCDGSSARVCIYRKQEK